MLFSNSPTMTFEDVALNTYNPILLPPTGSQKIRGAAAVAWGSFLWFATVMLVSGLVALGVKSLRGPRLQPCSVACRLPSVVVATSRYTRSRG